MNSVMMWEWHVLDWFYVIGNNFWDGVFYFITTFFGGSAVAIVILAILYWVVNKEEGEKIAFSLITCLCVNNFLKLLFVEKRPFEYDGQQHLQKLPGKDSATGSSFPSGHAQNSSAFYTSLAIKVHKRFFSWLCGILIFLVLISRLYLGVHFPHDVIVGSLLGISIALGGILVMNRFYSKKFWIYGGCLIVFLPFLFFGRAENDFYRSYGLMAGFVLGIAIENRFIHFDLPSTKKAGFLRILFSLAILGVLFLGFHFLLKAVEQNLSKTFYYWTTLVCYFVLSLSAFGLIPFFFRKEKNK